MPIRRNDHLISPPAQSLDLGLIHIPHMMICLVVDGCFSLGVELPETATSSTLESSDLHDRNQFLHCNIRLSLSMVMDWMDARSVDEHGEKTLE